MTFTYQSTNVHTIGNRSITKYLQTNVIFFVYSDCKKNCNLVIFITKS